MSTFYSDPAVRQRLVEFLGGEPLESATAVYLTHPDGCQFTRPELHPPGELEWFFVRDLDIARSLADRESLLLHLDVEYVNFDVPGAAYVDARRTFDLQEPVVRTIEELLLNWGIEPLHLITGQGHHFVWRVRLDSPSAGRIEQLSPAPDRVAACLERFPTGVAAGVTREHQEAFSGLALLMEFLAQEIKRAAGGLAEVPVEITAVHVAPGRSGQREMISIDTSEYGDPLHTRMVRMPFTNYLKPWLTGVAHQLGMGDAMFRAIPLHEMDVREALKSRQSEHAVRELARRAGTRIPLQEEGTTRLLNDYMGSTLRAFHEEFYALAHDPPEVWAHTYARTPLDPLPHCVRDLLAWPNDRLLKPSGMQLVTRVLLAEGWHPRHIAGLIRSKFEDASFGWGVSWADYEPGTRADFYTRLFAGQLATGLDTLADFTCAATRDKGFCATADNDCLLQRYSNTLLASSKLLATDKLLARSPAKLLAHSAP
jgi:hypothetical protein